MDADYLGMPELAGQVSVAVEAGTVLGVVRNVGWQDLQSVMAGQARVLDQIDLTHTLQKTTSLISSTSELYVLPERRL